MLLRKWCDNYYHNCHITLLTTGYRYNEAITTALSHCRFNMMCIVEFGVNLKVATFLFSPKKQEKIMIYIYGFIRLCRSAWRTHSMEMIFVMFCSCLFVLPISTVTIITSSSVLHMYPSVMATTLKKQDFFLHNVSPMVILLVHT